ncbi:hypothetical protein BDN72DRAFT_841998 [Pluteus cervinus]|uniref:Uncharacterized protein n=1 Tax=Pluteus cervinus TaxID=181527 RepID=A0ACD3ARH3_9AGAR|nr:hypothetical protein BDN72DRAFT_841998 [Pluteus cervinus]
MHFSAFSLLPLLALADVALSVCPGFNYAIGNAQPLNTGYKRWLIYDDSCKEADNLVMTTDGNLCTSGVFGCSSPPLAINTYRNTRTGLNYACRPDPNSGVCGNDVISVCCRNDGH